LIAAVKPSEPARQQQADQKSTETERCDVAGRPQCEIADAADQEISDHEVEEAQSMLTVEVDRPSPGGFANGDWNGSPIRPATTWGIALVRKAPPKK
jgi:hypothetical protein